MKRIKKRWYVITGVVVLIAGFIFYQFVESRLPSGSVGDLMLTGQYSAEIVNRSEIEHTLGLDAPAYQKMFNNITVPGPETYAPSDYYSTESGNNTTSSVVDININPAEQRMIVRTANLTMAVGDINAAVSEITRITNNSNGYVVSADKTSNDNSISGIVSIRVPATQFDSIMESLRSMAIKVMSDNVSATDVSEEYTDLSSKLRNLELAESQLIEIMKKAEKVEDVLAVQKQIVDTREELEITKGKIQYLEQTSAMSLITINLQQSTMFVEMYAGTRYAKTKDNIGFAVNIQGGISPFSYEWDFGDGSVSTDAEPWHKYDSSGDYTVTVTITDDKGNKATDTRTDYITIAPGWSPGDVFESAWRGLLSFFRFVYVVLVWLLIFSPVVIVVGIIWYLIRRKRKNSKLKSGRENPVAS